MSKTFEYSENQKRAIYETNGNVLLSAGAGSGKTAVLSERIYQLVKSGADLSRFLVLTFTNLASEEMRKRIRKKIMNDPLLKDQLSKVESSHIETFDAFALFLVKKYAYRIGVSPNIQIIDSNLLTIKKMGIRDKILTYLYSSKNSDFIDLISTYCTKDDKNIREFILKICAYVDNLKDRDEYFSSYFEKHFNEEMIRSFINDQYLYLVNAINAAIDQIQLLEDTEDVDVVTDYLQSFLDETNDYDSLTLKLEGFSFPGVLHDKTPDLNYRNAVKSKLVDAIKSNASFGYSSDIIEQYMSTKKHVKVLLDIVKQIEEEIDAFKKEKNSYSFQDVAFMALRLLDEKDVQEQMSNYFQYILVDEYQDTSILQELVLQKLGKNNICMVGDVKQSIYRFRNADCTIFQEKYNLYSKNDGGSLISLNTSYRSRKEIVQFVNDFFGPVMDIKYGPIDYKSGHNFEYGFKDYDDLSDGKDNYEPRIIKYQIEKGKPSFNTEIEIVASDIINKINNKYKVYDNDAKTYRDCSFKDFAIIMNKGTQFNHLKGELMKRGIPCRLFYDEEIIDTDIAHVIKNLLILLNSAIKEEYDAKFQHAFVSIARSFLYRYKDSEIYEIVKKKSYQNSEIMKLVNEIKGKVQYSPLSIIMETLMYRFDVYRKAITLTSFVNNTNKVSLFINIAQSMDGFGFSIDDLITYIEAIREFKLKIPYMDLDVSDDSVAITTTHRSKGLEYPIVYLPGLTSNLKQKLPSAFLIHNKFGILLPVTGNTNKSSLFIHLLKVEEDKAQFEEQIRLLYVAITRARERLIMITGMKEKEDPIVLNPTYVSNYKSLLYYLNFYSKFGVDYVPSEETLNIESKTYQAQDISLQHIVVPPEFVEQKKASKDRDDSVAEELLKFGSQIHYLLEIANYESKDLSFIKDRRMKRYVENVLKADNFTNVKNEDVLHEYSFYDEKNNVSGVIDCLIIRNDSIDIIDFKLKNIDDEKYVMQLHTYRDYIKQISDKNIHMYLIAAITGEVKEIE